MLSAAVVTPVVNFPINDALMTWKRNIATQQHPRAVDSLGA